ncbi:MAG: DNA polymerase III subunit delta [Hyphomicrobiales bacterium]|jgi:DNA polymerase-3 subunit delta|nr:DNA polymerase III subunit delta [Hyphomicrobiales bacterium]
MVAVKAHEADRALRSLGKDIRVVLIYGPDHGLVSERAEALAHQHIAGGSDPFQLVRLDGADIAADPMRLVDEANTIGLFGGQRAIRVSTTSRSLVAAVEPVLATPPLDALIVLEGGDLARNHALRLMVERAKSGLAVPCYADTGRTLDALIDPILKDNRIDIDHEARTLLLSRLGADRQLSRREIEKLAAYCMGKTRIEVADVDMVVGDAAARDVDDVVDQLFTGSMERMDRSFRRLTLAGEDPVVLLGFVVRHGLALLAARRSLEQDHRPLAEVVAGMRGMSFTRKPAIESALARWTVQSLVGALATVHSAMAQARRHPALAEELAARALWNLTRTAARE